MWLVVFTEQAQKDAKQLKAAGLAGKAKALVAAVREDPFKVPPRYEALVGNLSGLYSRRISLQHRFVYEVIKEEIERDGALYEGAVKVVRMWTHYDGVR
ncbi:Txe/YoeB family addiction module toxin [Collinsella sp. BG-O-102]|uniref:Txe/YoeB family addiction module toxin n=1 Tax=Collinsella sp. BG-O-102 TaxID=2949659 RepID=UPI00202EF0E5|nr:Txe/YoeB family addiction module toxin [Collinsella sp. BG-O-102]MCM0709363.1 Txe/YoeB family addiction module toxin [Collinsella sp. BG-O-102]UYI98636.1 MAG: Txe/YoeB family addiction module toxin [Coriobacteriaceae bacterium]